MRPLFLIAGIMAPSDAIKMTISSGTRLGRYEIRSQLGAGVMGEVYRAFDPKINFGLVDFPLWMMYIIQ